MGDNMIETEEGETFNVYEGDPDQETLRAVNGAQDIIDDVEDDDE